MRLRIEIGMARMTTLCHKSPPLASYINYGNALAGRCRNEAEVMLYTSLFTIRSRIPYCLKRLRSRKSIFAGLSARRRMKYEYH